MARNFIIGLLGITLLLMSCKKTENPNEPNLPAGATPYTENDIQFVPYTSGNRVFKKMPLLDSTLVFTFKERIRTEEYFAWDQTFFTYDTDSELEVEFRLRYLQADNSQKTLAMYMPYRDATGAVKRNLFEIPITPTNIETGFFELLVDFHDTLTINSIDWYNVYEVSELVNTNAGDDGPENYTKIFYNKTYGVIEMDQKNGTVWVLQQ